jgi:hypothetical protein
MHGVGRDIDFFLIDENVDFSCFIYIELRLPDMDEDESRGNPTLFPHSPKHDIGFFLENWYSLLLRQLCLYISLKIEI